jgi:hypothetical protein
MQILLRLTVEKFPRKLAPNPRRIMVGSLNKLSALTSLMLNPVALNTVRLIDSLVRIAPCLDSLNLEGTSRARVAKSPNSGGLLSILLTQNCGCISGRVSRPWKCTKRGLGGLSEPYCSRSESVRRSNRPPAKVRDRSTEPIFVSVFNQSFSISK